MNSVHIAVVSTVQVADQGYLARVVAAIQAQVQQELWPAWGNHGVPQATVMLYPSMTDAPDDAYFVLLVSDAHGLGGFHVPHPRPSDPPSYPRGIFAVVRYAPGDTLWATNLSHEVLEMLVDPLGTRTQSGPAPNQPSIEAQYLMEVCDPCIALACRYARPGFSDVPLCDFCFPAYYGIESGGSFSRSGNIPSPLTIAPDGYQVFSAQGYGWWEISWNPQAPGNPNILSIPDPTLVNLAARNLRGAVDRRRPYDGPHTELTLEERRNRGVRSMHQPRKFHRAARRAIAHAASIGLVL